MNTKHYFEVTHGKTHKVFGPYPTLEAARKASFFYREPNALHHAQKNNHKGYAAFSTCGYEDEELTSFAADPEAFGYKRTVVKAVAPMNAKWKAAPYDTAFRESYFNDSYKQIFGVAFDAEGST